MARVVLQVLAIVFALVGVALVVVALWVDLDAADKIASVAGACVGFLGCALSIYFEVRQGTGGHVVHADGSGAVASASNAVSNATGRNSKVTRRSAATPVSTPPGDGRHQVSASGPGSVAAVGDVTSNATGESSEVEEQ